MPFQGTEEPAVKLTMADKLKFDDVRIILADPRTHIRSTLKIALAHAEIEGIEHTGSVGNVAEAVEQAAGPDIVICDMALDGDGACNLVHGIRHNAMGRNPFVCVIGITWTPTATEVTRAIDSGVDHLVSAPLSPEQILTRISALVRQRAPFVVTSDYVGPDRRKLRREASKIPLFTVPNSLRDKANGTWDPARFDREIENAIGDLNTRQVDRQAEDIMILAGVVADQAITKGDGFKSNVTQLHDMVQKMDHAASNQGLFHVSELCRACVGIVEEIRKSGGYDIQKDIELLKQLGRAIRTALDPEHNSNKIAHDIAQVVSGAH